MIDLDSMLDNLFDRIDNESVVHHGQTVYFNRDEPMDIGVEVVE